MKVDSKFDALKHAYFEKYEREMIGKQMGQYGYDFKMDKGTSQSIEEPKAILSYYLGKKFYYSLIHVNKFIIFFPYFMQFIIHKYLVTTFSKSLYNLKQSFRFAHVRNLFNLKVFDFTKFYLKIIVFVFKNVGHFNVIYVVKNEGKSFGPMKVYTTEDDKCRFVMDGICDCSDVPVKVGQTLVKSFSAVLVDDKGKKPESVGVIDRMNTDEKEFYDKMRKKINRKLEQCNDKVGDKWTRTRKSRDVPKLEPASVEKTDKIKKTVTIDPFIEERKTLTSSIEHYKRLYESSQSELKNAQNTAIMPYPPVERMNILKELKSHGLNSKSMINKFFVDNDMKRYGFSPKY